MEGHFSVVWCNFGEEDEFKRKNLTDIIFFLTSAKKAIFRKFQRYFAEIVNLGYNMNDCDLDQAHNSSSLSCDLRHLHIHSVCRKIQGRNLQYSLLRWSGSV
jgi:hypothetical protein